MTLRVDVGGKDVSAADMTRLTSKDTYVMELIDVLRRSCALTRKDPNAALLCRSYNICPVDGRSSIRKVISVINGVRFFPCDHFLDDLSRA